MNNLSIPVAIEKIEMIIKATFALALFALRAPPPSPAKTLRPDGFR